METIEVKDGAVQLAISGAYTAEEAAQLVRKLCEALADATQHRASDGVPQLQAGPFQCFGDWHEGRFHLGINAPLCGWVFALLGTDAVAALQALLRQQDVAGQVGPGQDPRLQ